MSTVYTDSDAQADARRRTVLVAVVNNPADLQRIASEGWYRIPQRRAPRRVGADYLAFYQTGKFKDAPEAQTITFYASTRRYRLSRAASSCRTKLTIPAPKTTTSASTSAHCSGWSAYPLSQLAPHHLHPHYAAPPAHCHRRARAVLSGRPFRQALAHAARQPSAAHGEPHRRGLARRHHPAAPAAATSASAAPTTRTPAPTKFIRSPRPTAGRSFGFRRTSLENDMDGCLRNIGSALISLGGSELNVD